MSLGYTVLVLIVYALSVTRVTKLINSDMITDPIRLWIARQAEAAGDAAVEAENAMQPLLAAKQTRRQQRWNVAYDFAQCPWCPSVWIAFGTAWIPLWFAHNPVAQYVGVALAAAHLAGVGAAILGALGGEDDIELTKG